MFRHCRAAFTLLIFILSFAANAANLTPTVSITSPAAGATFTAPAAITLNAAASDTDGTIASVKFYSGTTLLSTEKKAPYSYIWKKVAAGSYSITAQATDDNGAVTTSSAIAVTVSATNTPPTVSITSPATGATFTAPAAITINATATDSNGVVSKVDFYHGATLLGSDTTAPYSYAWTNAPAGSYSITAQATDDNGAVTTSSAIAVTVSAANTPPTVSISNPINGSRFPTTGGAITLTADARDSDGTVVKVEFYNGATLLGVANAVPFTIQLPSLAAGDYNLTALATDNFGAITISTIVSISVYSQPTISITSPANGTRFATVPANIPFTVNATHPGGTITKVEYYNGSVLIGTATTAPYSFTWASVPNGGYLIRAKVTDSLGVTTASASIKVNVGDGETITYLHNDFAGSPLAATDTAGNIVWKENYRPFGERLTNQAESADNRQWFHGKAVDTDTGLQYFGARYYDPVLGRFMGVDPVGFQEDNIHSFNKYAYGNNNPYRYIDPDGRAAFLVLLIPVLEAAAVRGAIWVAQRQAGAIMAAEIGAGVATGAAMGGVSAAEGLAAKAVSINASKALANKLSAVESAEAAAVRVRNLPDGRIRYYEGEIAARNPGPTRGASYVTELNPSNGNSRSWYEAYDQTGNVNRVHPKTLNGQTVNSQHYPPTGKELGQ